MPTNGGCLGGRGAGRLRSPRAEVPVSPAIVRRAALPLVALSLLGCSPRSGGAQAVAVAPLVSATPLPAPPSPPSSLVTGEEEVFPLVLVHGIQGAPESWGPVVDDLSSGRTVFRTAYASDLAQLSAASVSRSSVFAVGYYKHALADPLFYGGHGSIGGCPVPRTD